MKNWIVTCAALAACAVPLHAGGASAAAIDYIFTGTGSWTLDGVASEPDSTFTLTYVSDTSTITSSGGTPPQFTNVGVGTFVSGSTAVTMTGGTNEVSDNNAAPGFMAFEQITETSAGPPPVINVAVEALTGPPFDSYDLSKALSLTSGGLSTGASTYFTSGGNLVFTADSITSLSFKATTSSVPEPSTWAMMFAGFAGLGFLGYRQTAKARVAA